MKVAIAHDWLTRFAGSERVVKAFHEMFPDAPIYCAVADPETVARELPHADVRPLLSSGLPGILTSWHLYAPAIVAAWSALRVEADLLIVSNHFAAHGAARRAQGKVIGYYHTPMRLAWVSDVERDRATGVVSLAARTAAPALRRWDARSARSVDVLLANSATTAERISRAYGRTAAVLHPPVEIEEFSAVRPSRDPAHFLCFGRLVPYKRVDLAIQACSSLGLPLVVAGDGPDQERLRSLAGPSVRFESNVSTERYRLLLAHATALIFPGEEDFGIVPVEAAAAGVPVIAYARGGIRDSVAGLPGTVLFNEQTVESLIAAIQESVTGEPAAPSVASLIRFSANAFTDGMANVISSAMSSGQVLRE